MKLPQWETQFKPLSDQGWGVREGQKILADAFIKALNERSSLIGEAGTGSGKSFIAAIPVIHAIKEAQREHKVYRAIISTETITLQDQIVNKDLPMLAKIYGDFSYKKLMGRSNYLCFDAAHTKTIGNADLSNIFMRLEGANSRITTGERSDVEKVLGREITNDQWEALTGSSEFCADNKCEDPHRCYGTKARKQALTADIVVCNHSILATDVESKRNSSLGDGLLGQYDTIIVDEGHRLAPVFASHFTETINGYEINQMGIDIITGADESKSLVTVDTQGINSAVEDLQKILDLAIEYYSHGVDDWGRSEVPLTFKYFSGVTPRFIDIMTAYETTVPQRLTTIIEKLEKHVAVTEKALKEAKDDSKWAKVRKGVRKSTKIIEFCTIMRDSLMSQDGIVNNYGMFGVVVNGWMRRDGTKGASILLEPLDVAPQIKQLWAQANTSLLMSATLKDPTHKDPYKYIKMSTGFPESPVVVVHSPFNVQTQQIVYITKANRPKINVEGARFSFEEFYDLLMQSKGRTLGLFTSRVELNEAARLLKKKQAEGKFPYRILVQEPESDKKRLAEEFKKDTHSVLLGTDSFMTGFDAPGETLSQVILCKFTMPRYNAQMKQKMEYWKSRGFPNYYKRLSLEKFIQAAGRGIRSTECKAVFSLLDHAAMDTSSHVFKTAKMGVEQLESPITQNLEDVGGFVSGSSIQ